MEDNKKFPFKNSDLVTCADGYLFVGINVLGIDEEKLAEVMQAMYDVNIYVQYIGHFYKIVTCEHYIRIELVTKPGSPGILQYAYNCIDKTLVLETCKTAWSTHLSNLFHDDSSRNFETDTSLPF